MDWIIEGLRTISGSIDVALMWLAKQVFNVFSAICKVDLLSNGELQKFTARIYVLLGVIMLIKLSMTVFKYLISPDDMSDKSKGFGKLIQNVVIALLLIVSVPTLYNFAMKIQTTVINSNVIGNFILGTTSSKTSTKTDSTNENDDKMGESSDKIIYSVYSTFMSPRLDLSTATSCKKTSIVSVNETYRNECENSGNSGFSATKVFEGLKTAGGETITTDYLIKQGGASILHCDCASELANSAESDGAAAVKAYMRATYIGGIEGIKSLVYGEMSGTGNNATRGVAPINVELKSGEYSYLFSYMWGISWAAAIFLTYIFFCFCIDVGIRVIKLAFLVIIAPIPILSLVDPYKKGEMFNQWTKMLGFTYADVFIRYGSVFFIIYVLSLMPNIIGTLFSTGAGAFATLFIIFGALLFAKQLPDIISTLIPGMKEFGGKGLNPLKRLGEAPILGRGVKALGAGAAAGIGAYNANRWARSDGKKLLKEQNRLDKKRGVDPATRKANLKRGMKDLKNDNKLLSGTGSSMKNAFDDVRGNQTIFGGEKKSTLAKNRAERRKATNEQLQKMRDGYKKENKANKILARGEAAAASAETSAKMA